ncbi:MAG: RdgB/HAM1 family non-canonical purine NTP pyrophosphatase [Gammaproteobacteria bacterium]|nr:RdgB/HAM1 family non-canonical purine NTP pyrophosphatase [Gammaproteobacteria bacterium]
MRQVVLASGNPGKIKEFSELLAPLDLEILPQSLFDTPEAEETGLSFVENAILKARNAAEHSQRPALADDSGLEVDALNGAPGIYSARYAGEHATDALNNQKLLEALQNTPPHKRTARFRCVLVYLRHTHDPSPVIAEGTWEGRINQTLEGEQGFGYDPLFYIPALRCTAAQLLSADKRQYSHRGQALQDLLRNLEKITR